MTGPAVPSDEELRSAFISTLTAFNVPSNKTDDEIIADIAGALLPVVRRYADQRAAEELRSVASGVGGGAGIVGLPGAVKQALGIAAGVIYVRADELGAREATP